MSRRRALPLALVLVAASALVSGCKSKPTAPSGPPPELTGLATVPASAQVVIGADVGKLAGSPVIDRVVEQLLLRDHTLGDRWQRLQDNCKIDVGKQVKRVMLAIGPSGGNTAAGTGPVIMVVVGSLPEVELKDCVGKLIGTGGGTVTGKSVFGRTLYFAKDGNRSMHFGYGRPDTVVLGANEAYVTDALGTGQKAPDNAELTALLKRVNQHAPLWGAGNVDPRIASALVQVTDGKLKAGPQAYTVSADLSDGANLELGVVMASADDAKALESYVKSELALLTAAAQLKSLGPVVAKVTAAIDPEAREQVRFRAVLTVDDLNLLLSALDGAGGAAQDSAPAAPGSGSGPPGGFGSGSDSQRPTLR